MINSLWIATSMGLHRVARIKSCRSCGIKTIFTIVGKLPEGGGSVVEGGATAADWGE